MQQVLNLLEQLNISCNFVEHEAVYTCEQAEFVKNLINGQGYKNLFLRNNKKHFFLYVLPDDKRANLKELGKQLNIGHLSFGSEQALWDILKLKAGSVSPFGIINDEENLVTLIIDSDLKDKVLLFHPNDNRATFSIEYMDLIKVIEYLKHKFVII
ncbi:MAG: prolyl-tRNA synthetase associated domain-containing protein [Oscillospiraceae bacterium]